MTSSSALVPYRGGPATSTTLVTTSSSSPNSLISSKLFTAQTGTAIATELLYRVLFEILHRLIASLQRFVGKQLDTFSSFLERRYAERQEAQREALEAAREAQAKSKDGLRITEEVGRAAMERGFVGRGPACPVTGGGGGGGKEKGEGKWRPRGWVGEVWDGIQVGRMVEKDFWVHPFQN